MHNLLNRSPGYFSNGLVGYLGPRQIPPLLAVTSLAPGSVQTVEFLESCLSPDTEPPGASFNKFKLSTWIVLTPGMFLKAFVKPWS